MADSGVDLRSPTGDAPTDRLLACKHTATDEVMRFDTFSSAHSNMGYENEQKNRTTVRSVSYAFSLIWSPSTGLNLQICQNSQN